MVGMETWKPPWERSYAENRELLSLPAPHPFYERYKPVFLARGGEHIVYRSDAVPNQVIKVNTDWVAAFLERSDFTQALATAAAERQRAWDTLARHFGESATLDTQVRIETFPLTPRCTFEIFKANRHDLPSEVNTLVVSQRFAEELQSQPSYTIAAGYLEDISELSTEEYVGLTSSLLFGDAARFNRTQFVTYYGQRGLAALLDIATSSDSFRNCLRDFISKACRYTLATGATLDLAGQGNVAFVFTNEEWNYLLPDALSPGGENSIHHAATLLTQVEQGATLTRKQRYVLFNVLHYVRIINGISMACGFNECIQIPNISAPSLHPHIPELLSQIRERKSITA